MFAKKKDSKLSKMRMPEDPSGDASMDLGEMAPEDMGAALTDAEDGSTSEPSAAADLEGASDEDLMAEIKKRGLMKNLESSPHSEEGEEGSY